jgi:hypothetical protein
MPCRSCASRSFFGFERQTVPHPLSVVCSPLGDYLALECSPFRYAVPVKKRLVALRQIRSKILRARQLSLALMSAGGNAQDIVPSFIRLNHLLRRNQLRAAEHELDILLARVQLKTALHDFGKSAA